MALSQLFWDVLMPWNLKSTYFPLKMIHFLSLNIWYVIYAVFWIKYWNLKLPHHSILFFFPICTVSQLFWNRVCICIYIYKERESRQIRQKYIQIKSQTLLCKPTQDFLAIFQCLVNPLNLTEIVWSQALFRVNRKKWVCVCKHCSCHGNKHLRGSYLWLK